MPEDMPDRMPEDMPDRMPEDMPDRMPEDLPVTKCINVMVEITRSKVIVDFNSKMLFTNFTTTTTTQRSKTIPLKTTVKTDCEAVGV